jgi:hypothetical protein
MSDFETWRVPLSVFAVCALVTGPAFAQGAGSVRPGE